MAHARRLDVLQKQMRAGYATTTERVTEKAAEAVEDAAEGTVKQLHPAFTKFLNSGYMESQRQLRDELLTREWDGTVAPWAAVKGLAQFEQYVVEKGRDVDIHVSWEVMQRLYADPSDLSPLEGNERARLLAHAFITQAREAQRWEVYKQVSETSKQLADVIESGERTGASTLWSLIRRMLPLPPFLK
eukprot:GHRQ01033156.1.p1 GENE.GHRQ01033156.1~~GHRQ01033156.1.p1  ORF type:complete len:221 (+),score=72.01 GHRQ01033156.1:102-665(+)